jgi:hypothetical protein
VFGVSCPTINLCVALASTGNVVTSTNPTGGSAAWKVSSVEPFSQYGGLSSVSCPNSGLCVAVDTLNPANVVTSSNPTGGTSAWKVTSLSGIGAGLYDVSCPSSGLCVAVDGNGDVVTSFNPTGGASTWSLTHVAGTNCAGSGELGPSPCSLTGVSCPSNGLCVAVDAFGDVVTSSNPTGGPEAWTVTRVDGFNSLSAVSCPSSDLCVAVDYYGNVVTSTNPSGGIAAWKVTHVDGTSTCAPSQFGSPCSLTGVSCPSTRLCVAVDLGGNVLTSSNPTGDSAAWKVTKEIGGFFSGVSCPTMSMCVAFRGAEGGSGVVTSTNPTGGAAAWHASDLNSLGGGSVSGVSCPSNGLCAAVDDSGNTVISSNPSGGALAWKVTHVYGPIGCGPVPMDPDAEPSPCYLNSIACPSSSTCVAVGDEGNAVSFSSSTGEAAAWMVTNVDSSNSLSAVSCPSSEFCVAVDRSGNIVTGAVRAATATTTG